MFIADLINTMDIDFNEKVANIVVKLQQNWGIY